MLFLSGLESPKMYMAISVITMEITVVISNVTKVGSKPVYINILKPRLQTNTIKDLKTLLKAKNLIL